MLPTSLNQMEVTSTAKTGWFCVEKNGQLSQSTFGDVADSDIIWTNELLLESNGEIDSVEDGDGVVDRRSRAEQS